MSDFDSGKVAEIHQQLHSHLPSDSALRVKALETLLVEMNTILVENQSQVSASMEDIRGLTRSLRSFLDYLDRNPGALIWGKD